MDFPKPEIFGNPLLKDFGDIVMPKDLPWGEIQPGWWVLLAIIVVSISIYSYRRYKHWRRNAYRRQALAQMTASESERDITAILKEASVSAFPSDNIETLWGSDWVEYLNQKTEKPCFIAGDEERFNSLLTQPQENWPDDIAQLRDRARSWLEQHREEAL